ncbi:hypothetical protein BDV26DRAFT_84046 [Aspergillus bertholletiae]|uniref:Uncharacterized protein n=1 Tax=Aspergillus bertholletiae TaxID=1226010 RepID=A0A5N7ASH4_9EURO|nr:hypothetical protein BDV26DRAFT_84046 [Aspergillus bertholletiae]
MKQLVSGHQSSTHHLTVAILSHLSPERNVLELSLSILFAESLLLDSAKLIFDSGLKTCQGRHAPIVDLLTVAAAGVIAFRGMVPKETLPEGGLRAYGFRVDHVNHLGIRRGKMETKGDTHAVLDSNAWSRAYALLAFGSCTICYVVSTSLLPDKVKIFIHPASVAIIFGASSASFEITFMPMASPVFDLNRTYTVFPEIAVSILRNQSILALAAPTRLRMSTLTCRPRNHGIAC